MNLLIVDDVPANLRLLRAQLLREGHHVFDAANGIEGLDVLARESVDGVVSDILMPEMDGFRFCLEVRRSERFGSVPFVFYTSTYDSPEDRRLADDVGADAYVTKPSPVEVLLEALRGAKARPERPAQPAEAVSDAGGVMKQYSEALVRKLEDKNADLEAALAKLTAAHEETRLAEERFRQLAENIREAFFLIEPGNPQMLYVSPAYEDIWGRKLSNLMEDPHTWMDAIHAEDRDAALAAFRRMEQTGFVDHEYRILRPDGNARWIHARGFPIPNAAGKTYRVAGVAEDITDRRLALELADALESLKRSQEAQLQSEKLAALRRMVAGVAHEMNTPIGNALLAASSLQAQTAEFARLARSDLRRSSLERFVAGAREGSDIVLRGLEKAAELIRSFKQIVADESRFERRRFAILEVLDDLLRTHPIAKIAAVAVRREVPADLCMIGDPGQLAQVLGNLLTNAVLHGFDGRDGGSVTVSARLHDAENVVLTVHDDGRGIGAEDLKRVFDPFFTTKLGQGGGGVGLSICHRIVTQTLAGEIRAFSPPGQGTSIVLRLPIEAPAAPVQETA